MKIFEKKFCKKIERILFIDGCGFSFTHNYNVVDRVSFQKIPN